MGKLYKTLQLLWLGAALFSLCAGVYITTKGDISKAIIYFVITFVGGMMFMINRRRLKNMNNEINNSKDNSDTNPS